uniref:Uncharacterized protein n=1 Tax=Anguilla anguilla TaxID=7936 RepID=A0A0E9WKX1_ANGAN
MLVMLRPPIPWFDPPFALVQLEPNHVPWRAECMHVSIPSNHIICLFLSFVPSSLVEGVLISAISRCSDRLE